jgi:hypothetical protein
MGSLTKLSRVDQAGDLRGLLGTEFRIDRPTANPVAKLGKARIDQKLAAADDGNPIRQSFHVIQQVGADKHRAIISPGEGQQPFH